MFFKIIAAAASALACLSAAAAAPVHSRASSSAVIEGSYIVRLKENVATDTHMSWVRGIHARSNGKNDPAGVEREYNGPAFRGYAGRFDEQTVEESSSAEACRHSVLRAACDIRSTWRPFGMARLAVSRSRPRTSWWK
ncbi:subtilisin-like protease PR1D [Metarhizium album ARSEF 1941]|uniref:Subtilisin-like protease PR1D n=1 Tax=Metarhizium album (strain ARSEF 1941) TaxID=1081103 RepID=A0A0B2WJ31_METAS|nr:subtilisin-like protease PR1D [Metarhizium album ARSEF 1941]KHN93699.1 subtilisin-like protease PR1D [Metarhizium album ARSEF 1941]